MNTNIIAKAMAALAGMGGYGPRRESRIEDKGDQSPKFGKPTHTRQEPVPFIKVNRYFGTETVHFSPVSKSRRTPFHGRRKGLIMAMNIREGRPATEGLDLI